MMDGLLLAEPALMFFTLVIACVIAVIVCGIVALMIKCLVRAKGDEAIVKNGLGGLKVSFDSSIVIPVLHQFERVEISSRKLRYERSGDWALQFKCGTRVELVADVMIRINRTAEDVTRAVQFLGSERINDVDALKEHYSSMFNDSLETIAGSMDFAPFAANKDSFREALAKHIGTDLNGMILDDVCLHHLQKV